jgi:hypothetical protein
VANRRLSLIASKHGVFAELLIFARPPLRGRVPKANLNVPNGVLQRVKIVRAASFHPEFVADAEADQEEENGAEDALKRGERYEPSKLGPAFVDGTPVFTTFRVLFSY